MATSDPDAMWKPGYTGEIHRAARSARPARRLPRLVIGAVAIAGAVGVGASLVAITAGRTSPPESSAVRSIPSGSTERWAATLDVATVERVTGTRRTIVALTGWTPQLMALDADDGDVRWRTSSPEGAVLALEVVDGVVVGVFDGNGGRQLVLARDLTDGRRLWSASLPGASAFAEVTPRGIVVSRAGTGRGPATVERLDPRRGTVEASIEGEAVTVSTTTIQRREGDVIDVFDRSSFERVGRIDLGALDIPGRDPVNATVTDAGVVLVSPTAILVLDESGAVTATAPRPGGPATAVPRYLDAMEAAGPYLALRDGGRLRLYSVAADSIRPLWTTTAWLADWIVDGDDHLAVLDLLTGQEDRDTPPIQLVDAATGTVRWEGNRGALPERTHFTTLTGNGFLAAASAPERGDPGAVAGYGLDGRPIWSSPVSLGSSTTLVDGALVTIGSDGRTTTVTLRS